MNGQELERELNSPAQMHIREVVQALPEETLSLAWRSELNDRLRIEQSRKRKRDLFGWIWKPTAGLALAGALAIVLMLRMPQANPVPSESGDVERALVNSFVDNRASWEVTGDGLTVNEAKETTGSRTLPVDWEQEDIGSTL